jgi:tRNA-2-methylthio-N6-dimethylallyladenosine synthase
VQAGNVRILKRMNRRHTIADYLKLYEQMLFLMPTMGVSTDIIVGFPSETEAEFNDTAELFEKVKYDMAYISQYSARTGTPAFRLNDDVTIEEKHRREEVLNEILKRTAKERAGMFVGQEIEVLVEKINRRGMPSGKDTGFRTVNITNSTDVNLIGKFVKVRIVEALPFGMNGELVQES